MEMPMWSQVRAAVVAIAVFTALTGVAYPLVVTGVAQAALAHQAYGSIVTKDGHAVGSELIGQSFDDPKYFWGRLSATLDSNGKALPYNASASGGSNLGPTNPALTDAAKARIDALRAADPDSTAPVPVDLVTASGSGLDPDISPAAAEYQVHRVAKSRALDEQRVRDLVRSHVKDRQLVILGEPRVNVLELNLALDAL
jgi:K+-transporting ATPase ATPase C chain